MFHMINQRLRENSNLTFITESANVHMKRGRRGGGLGEGEEADGGVESG